MTNIILDSNITLKEIGELKDKAKQWAINNNATEKFIELAEIYWHLYPECGNVNPVLGYVQAAYKTNFGRYSEELKEEYNNPSGLKGCSEGKDSELKQNYILFNSIEDGVNAHLDHLALYAGGSQYPKQSSKDQRHFSYLCGVCKYIENLSAKWEPEETYSSEILKLMSEVSNTKTSELVKENSSESSKVISKTIVSPSNNSFDKVEKNIEILGKIQEVIKKLQNENKRLKEENEILKTNLDSYKEMVEKIISYVDTLS